MAIRTSPHGGSPRSAAAQTTEGAEGHVQGMRSSSPPADGPVPVAQAGARADRLHPASTLVPVAVLAALATGIGLFALTSEPSTSSLRAQVTSLRARTGTLQAELGSLQAGLAALRREASSSGAQLRASRIKVGSLQSRLANGQRTSLAAIASLKAASAGAAPISNVNRLDGSVDAQRVCIRQLQQEISGLKVRTASKNGRLTSASLANPTTISRECSSILNGSSGR